MEIFDDDNGKPWKKGNIHRTRKTIQKTSDPKTLLDIAMHGEYSFTNSKTDYTMNIAALQKLIEVKPDEAFWGEAMTKLRVGVGNFKGYEDEDKMWKSLIETAFTQLIDWRTYACIARETDDCSRALLALKNLADSLPFLGVARGDLYQIAADEDTIRPKKALSGNYYNDTGRTLQDAAQVVRNTAIHTLADEQSCMNLAMDNNSCMDSRIEALRLISDRDTLKKINATATDAKIIEIVANKMKSSKDLTMMLSTVTDIEIASVCSKIPTLSDLAYDIGIVINNEFHANETNNVKWAKEIEAKLAQWKRSAQKLMLIAQTDPERLIPIWNSLKKAINEATYHWTTRKKVGTYQTEYDGDVRNFPEYETTTHKKSLGLTFPDLPIEFKEKVADFDKGIIE